MRKKWNKREKATHRILPVGMLDFQTNLAQSGKQWDQELYLCSELIDLSTVRD